MYFVAQNPPFAGQIEIPEFPKYFVRKLSFRPAYHRRLRTDPVTSASGPHAHLSVKFRKDQGSPIGHKAGAH